ncbi:hypothetical protein TNCV_2638181 [Trichonephila clavipes]|nr:hypothetical protein TNCV_2638181 [Trichonephila clavipes]
MPCHEFETHRVGQRCSLNLSRAEMSSRWCGAERECTTRYDWALKHTSSVRCLETFRSIFAVTLPLVRSNSWDAQLAVPNDPRYPRLETNQRSGQATEG